MDIKRSHARCIMPVCTWLTLLLGLAASQTHGVAFKVQDVNLQACVQTIMQNKQWHQPQDVTQIKCHSKDIRSMVGLAQFENLETLSLYNNKLKQLSTDMASFKKLKTLNLARNNLTHLTISNLPSLTKLYVFDNKLENLTLSNLVSLTIFKANNNIINHFSYANVPNLEKIYIFNNALETTNIDDLPRLQYMDCRQNPMPDSLYDKMDKMNDITFLHDGNAEDW
jgi:Leucine-rich repeat (LRR) protein